MKRIFPAVKLRPQTPPIDKREIGVAAIPGNRRIYTSPSAPLRPTRAISQWTRNLEWRQAVTLHTAVGNNSITFFPFSCKACSLYLELWLCGTNSRRFERRFEFHDGLSEDNKKVRTIVCSEIRNNEKIIVFLLHVTFFLPKSVTFFRYFF